MGTSFLIYMLGNTCPKCISNISKYLGGEMTWPHNSQGIYVVDYLNQKRELY